ncbi:MAG: DUF4265 domain-containing protein [Gammaproteobacteria bacterium]|nr:DUF4265 domain-containing protein [Gammaproteobacteria bacterium]
MNANELEQLWVEFTDHTGLNEKLPVSRVNEEHYRLDEMPSFAYGVSVHDVVKATNNEQGILQFVELVEKSGNRTVRFLLSRFSIESDEAQTILAYVTEKGCHYSNLQPNVVSILVPQHVDLEQVTDYLRQAQVWWEHADPTWDDLFKS